MRGFGEEKTAPANGLEIVYQEMGDPDGEPLFLVMGLATQMIAWHPDFCGLLVDRGFRVVRFDNRDIGRSTKLKAAGLPSRVDMLAGRRATAPYLLSDMARDTFGLMDHLEIGSAHVAGASMGGMIAQTMAINQPARVRSLTSIMSTTGRRFTGMPTLKAFGVLFGGPPKGRDQVIERAVKTFKVIGSPAYPFEEDRIREIAATSYDRGHSAAGVARQLHAILASGDRTTALHDLVVPTSVIHGSADPLIRPSGGRATAAAVPDARLKIIEGMGHDLPQALWTEIADEIAANAARAGDPVAA
ncbi:MAG TPA: alpha/beta fold hydrolase [Solirubrobacterales bacterium]|nr:alpha/beta fold hydrolase [Solirubrobacterales bacterium]